MDKLMGDLERRCGWLMSRIFNGVIPSVINRLD